MTDPTQSVMPDQPDPEAAKKAYMIAVSAAAKTNAAAAAVTNARHNQKNDRHQHLHSFFDGNNKVTNGKAIYRYDDSTDDHIYLRCKVCSGTAIMRFVNEDGNAEMFSNGGRLLRTSSSSSSPSSSCLNEIVIQKEHSIWCDGHSLNNCQSTDFLKVMIEQTTKEDKDKIDNDKDKELFTINTYFNLRKKHRLPVTVKRGSKTMTVKRKWYNHQRRGQGVRVVHMFTCRDIKRFDIDNFSIFQRAIRKGFSTRSRLDYMAAAADCPDPPQPDPPQPNTPAISKNSVDCPNPSNTPAINNKSRRRSTRVESAATVESEPPAPDSPAITTEEEATAAAAAEEEENVDTVNWQETLGLPYWLAQWTQQDSFLMQRSILLEHPIAKIQSYDVLQRLLVPHFATTNKLQSNVKSKQQDETLYFNEASLESSQFECKYHQLSSSAQDNKEDGTVLPPSSYTSYTDTSNLLGNGKTKAYIRVGEFIKRNQFDRARDLSRYISPKDNETKYLPFILMVCCHYVIDLGASIKETQNYEDTWKNFNDDEKKKLHKIMSEVKEYTSAMKDIYVKIAPQLTTSNLKRFTWEEWVSLSSRYAGCRSEEELQRIEEMYKQLGEDEKRKALCFHYFAIMNLSAQSPDESTKLSYKTLTENVGLPKSFLLPLKEMELAEFVEVLIEVLRSSALQGTKVVPIIEMAIVATVFFGGDVGRMTAVQLRAITQISWKKSVIIRNAISVATGKDDDKSFCVGGDVHVIDVFDYFAYKILEEGSEIRKEWGKDSVKKKKYIWYMMHNIGVEVGGFMNELLGQTSQLKNDKPLIDIMRKEMTDKNKAWGEAMIEIESFTFPRIITIMNVNAVEVLESFFAAPHATWSII